MRNKQGSETKSNGGMMNNENILLKILVYSDQKVGNITLHEKIVLKAKDLGLIGATAIKGISGFIGKDTIRKPKLATLTERLPVSIEIIDTEENINKLLPFLNDSIQDGLVMLTSISGLKK